MKKIGLVSLIVIDVGFLFIILGFIFGFRVKDVKAFFTDSYKYELQEQIKITDNITSIKLNIQTKSIKINAHEEDFITIDHYKKEKETWTITHENGILNVSQKDNWSFFNISFGFSSEEKNTLIVNIPKNQLYNLDIINTTGSVTINDLTLKNLNLKLDTGSIKLTNISVNDSFSLKTVTGNISLKDITAKTVAAKTETGNINITNLSANELKTTINTGNIKLVNSYTDLTNLTTNTGSIVISGQYSLYTLELKTNTGSIKVDGSSKAKSYKVIKENEKIIAQTNTGSIKVTTK